jgi:GNAT superfamily N-acetyltransferase
MGCGRIGGVIEARRIPGTSADALELVKAMEAELATTFPPGLPGPPPPTAEQMSPPRGAYVALYDDGRLVAGGGVRELSPGVAEIKRMYVLPEARSRGLARRVLEELETAARELGYDRVRLDTGDPQPHARALYVSAGYREIGNYNDNGYASYWGEKTL